MHFGRKESNVKLRRWKWGIYPTQKRKIECNSEVLEYLFGRTDAVLSAVQPASYRAADCYDFADFPPDTFVFFIIIIIIIIIIVSGKKEPNENRKM